MDDIDRGGERMKLSELSSLFAVHTLKGDGNTEITGLQIDSRKVKPGDLFVCLTGHGYADRHEFAEAAVAQGAAALVVQRDVGLNIPSLFVKNTRDALALLADHFNGYPTREMNVIGLTGTNGKTTTAHIIERILADAGRHTGLMGTVGVKIGNDRCPSENTTLEPHSLHRYFRKMRDQSVETCVMEVSSQALEMGRVKGVRFRTALFTNLSQDHLDYHRTLDRYMAAKGLLFSRLGNEFHEDPAMRQYAVLNADEAASEYLAGVTTAQIVTYGIERDADVRASGIRITANGTEFDCSTFAGNTRIRLRLVGKFNVYNTLGAIAVSLLEGVSLADIANSLEKMDIVEGRMEPVHEGQDFVALVDYAHTPDGLENALATVKEFAQGRIITVFGCGGDRDRTKRPEMGRIAARYSDFLFVTSDNPRSEDPDAILADIEPGVLEASFPREQYRLIPDRREAIRRAVEKAGPGDVILIAGKGHETYQIMGGVTNHFDDREEVRKAIKGSKRGMQRD
jgi:UDP-N-acetylmuramoyl-L-alanyl-D-glutamate--2,6-diaminopimelate ligase